MKLLSLFIVLCLMVSEVRHQLHPKDGQLCPQTVELDFHYRENKAGCPVIVWFHGGGLEAGNKEIPASLKEKGLVVMGVNYRLLPRVTVRETLDDAEEGMVVWVFPLFRKKTTASTLRLLCRGCSRFCV